MTEYKMFLENNNWTVYYDAAMGKYLVEYHPNGVFEGQIDFFENNIDDGK